MLSFKGSLSVSCMKARHHLNLSKSCFVVLDTVLVRKAMVGWIPGRARLDTYKSFLYNTVEDPALALRERGSIWVYFKTVGSRGRRGGSYTKVFAKSADGILQVALHQDLESFIFAEFYIHTKVAVLAPQALLHDAITVFQRVNDFHYLVFVYAGHFQVIEVPADCDL